MTARHDILDRPESLKVPFYLSVGLHLTLAATSFIYGLIPAGEFARWGDPNSIGGGAVPITPVSNIPLPSRPGRVNPVANDTQSQAPAPPPEAPKPKPAPREQENAVALPIPEAPRAPAPPAAPQSRRRQREAPDPTRTNQVYSQSGAALTSPIFSTAQGSGGVGLGRGNPLGDRFGWYVTILQQEVARHWNTTQVDPRLQTAPPVIVAFEILKNGTARNVRVIQSSGHPALDYSCQRAIIDASPLPALPREYTPNSVDVEFHFELKR